MDLLILQNALCRAIDHAKSALSICHLSSSALFQQDTPVIIKYPFWRMTAQNKAATYACINYGEAVCPTEIEGQAICIDSDIAKVIAEIKR